MLIVPCRFPPLVNYLVPSIKDGFLLGILQELGSLTTEFALAAAYSSFRL